MPARTSASKISAALFHLGLATVTVLAGCATQPLPPRIVWAGTYTTTDATFAPATGALGGGTIGLQGISPMAETTYVRAATGSRFGIRFVFPALRSGETAKYRVKWTFPPPGIRDPAIGKAAISQAHDDACSVAECFAGWSITYDWEKVPGVWMVQILDGDKVLLGQQFEVH